MTAFGFTNDSYIKNTGTHQDEFIVVRAPLADPYGTNKPTNIASLDSLMNFFTEATGYGCFFSSIDGNNQVLTTNILVLMSKIVFEQHKDSKVLVLNPMKEDDNDSDSDDSDEDIDQMKT